MSAVRRIAFLPVVFVSFGLAATSHAGTAATSAELAGLEQPVRLVRDSLGVPHVFARTEHDAYFMVGYLHAQDRLFQMDATRRQASGTLAELLGPAALPGDVQLRTLGLRRAGARSLAALSPQSVAMLEAYAAGVNAWTSSHPLPSEYAALELTSTAPWTALDSVAVTKLLAFGLSFDLSDISNTQRLLAYQAAGVAGGFDGLALFTQDVVRSEPFAHAPSIDPGEHSGPVAAHGRPAWSSAFLEGSTVAHAAAAVENAEAFDATLSHDNGSNIWVVSGAKATSGRPMVASDPHLSLGSPATFYEIGLDVSGRDPIALYGVTFPGAPFVVHGMNEHIAWGSTVNPTDVTDVFQENVVTAGGVPVATVYQGSQEPTQIIPETYRANQIGNGTPNDVALVPPGGAIPPVTVVVPRHGPLIAPNLSVQFTGFYPTREPDYFFLLARARDVNDAKSALRYFDFGAQNWMFADDSGNVAYYTDREVPLREDLQAGTVAGLPPYFIRNGTGGNEWIADPTQAEDQALPYEILPAGELVQLVNPARGWISNANQDPTGQTYDNDPLNELRPGGGILYLSPGYSDGNRNARVRARIAEALAGDGSISFAEMQSIQADVQLHDASVLMPSIVAAMAAARTPGAPPQLAALGANPLLQEAVARLAGWGFSTPTGLPEGYDAADTDGVRAPPTQAEIDASVAATIYSLWRGQALALFVDQPLAAAGLGGFLPPGDQAMTALRRLLSSSTGLGVSGLPFFAGPADRDVKVLTALQNALGLAASPAFAPAFGGSPNLADYRWGKLHRITFAHLLGGPFSLPPGGGLVDLGPGLPGVATDGGFSVVDASSHNPRAATLNGFRFGGGPARRFVAQTNTSHPEAVQVIPGGESGNPAGAFFGNQLGLWLTNDYHRATVQVGEIMRDAVLTQEFTPGS